MSGWQWKEKVFSGESFLTSFERKGSKKKIKKYINGKESRRKKGNDSKCQYVFFFFSRCFFVKQTFQLYLLSFFWKHYSTFSSLCTIVHISLWDLSSIIIIITISYHQKSLSIPIVLFFTFFQNCCRLQHNLWILFLFSGCWLHLNLFWLKTKAEKNKEKVVFFIFFFYRFPFFLCEYFKNNMW